MGGNQFGLVRRFVSYSISQVVFRSITVTSTLTESEDYHWFCEWISVNFNRKQDENSSILINKP